VFHQAAIANPSLYHHAVLHSDRRRPARHDQRAAYDTPVHRAARLSWSARCTPFVWSFDARRRDDEVALPNLGWSQAYSGKRGDGQRRSAPHVILMLAGIRLRRVVSALYLPAGLPCKRTVWPAVHTPPEILHAIDPRCAAGPAARSGGLARLSGRRRKRRDAFTPDPEEAGCRRNCQALLHSN
jgi:hypothetical protein